MGVDHIGPAAASLVARRFELRCYCLTGMSQGDNPRNAVSGAGWVAHSGILQHNVIIIKKMHFPLIVHWQHAFISRSKVLSLGRINGGKLLSIT